MLGNRHMKVRKGRECEESESERKEKKVKCENIQRKGWGSSKRTGKP